MWPFKRRAKPAPPPPDTPKPRAVGRNVSPLLPRASADMIRDMLPRVFQRKHTDFVPVGAGRAASMDEALQAGGYGALPDVYEVQDNLPGVLFSWFAAHSFIGHQMCAILAQHWLIAKACGQAPKDAIQNGYKVVPAYDDGREVSPKLAAKIAEIDKAMKVLTECREASRNSRIFGIRHVLFQVDGIDQEAPFNLDGVRPGSYRGMSQIDPYWLTPVLDTASIGDPASKHFYEPTWWRLPNGQKVHRSHFVILREEEVPDLLKPTYYYGGLPMTQQIYERVYAAERTANEAPELALTKRLVTMQGSLENYLSDENEVTERLHAFNQMRSNFGFLVVGEDENISQTDTSLADFDGLIMSQYQLVAAIARTPATKILGTSPKGFNATGEHEKDSYKQELVSIQTTDMTPIVERHHQLVARSHFADRPGLVISVEWQPVEAPKPIEKADINLKKAQTSQALVTAGIVSADEERDRLIADPESGYAGLASFDEPEMDETDLETDEAEEGQNAETSDF